jgi:hypothetical protein
MPPYTLNVNLTEEALRLVNASQQRVVIAKPTQGGPNVAWQVFRPMEANSVSWVEEFGIYASNTVIENGAVLRQTSHTNGAAVDGKVYTLQEDGAFSGPGADQRPGSYYVENDFSEKGQSATVGLVQSATVNGVTIEGNAISAAPIPHHNLTSMTPYTVLYIWTESNVVSNTVVSSTSSAQLKVTFGGGKNEASVHYDMGVGGFIEGKSAEDEEEQEGVSFELWSPANF